MPKRHSSTSWTEARPGRDELEETFSTLMGDVVEPRREFVQANALEVADLDV